MPCGRRCPARRKGRTQLKNAREQLLKEHPEAEVILAGIEAVRLGGASFTMKPEDIAAAIIKLAASGP